MIHIVDDMYLDADTNQYILKIWSGATQISRGKEIPSGVRNMYFSDFESLLNKLHTIMIRRSIEMASNLDELATEFIKAREKIHSIARKIDPPALQ